MDETVKIIRVFLGEGLIGWIHARDKGKVKYLSYCVHQVVKLAGEDISDGTRCLVEIIIFICFTLHLV